MEIKQIERKLQQVLPPLFFNHLISSVAHLRFQLSGKKSLLAPNDQIQSLKTKKRAFLLATGPSIKSQDLTLLEGEDCYSISNFYLHDDINTINPKLHFFAPYHLPLILENYIDWLKTADAQLPPETSIVLGYKESELVKKHKLFPNRKVFYLFLDRVKPTFPLKLSSPLPNPKTGPQMILPVLINMGYEEIYLVGCDHTVLRDFGKTITNFYSPEKDMRKNATSGEAWPNILSQLEGNASLFRLYYEYAHLLNKNYPSTKVYNLSEDTWLDCFEPRKFETLFSD